MKTEDNSSWWSYIFAILIGGGIALYVEYMDREKKHEAEIELAKENQAKLEVAQREADAEFKRELEKTSITARFIKYRYYEKSLPIQQEYSGLNFYSQPLKYVDIFCSLKNPEKGETITKVAISVYFGAKGYFSESTSLNEHFITELEVNLPPNTISNLTFTVPQPNDINMVFERVKLERVIKSDGTVTNWDNYWLY